MTPSVTGTLAVKLKSRAGRLHRHTIVNIGVRPP